MEPTVSTVLAVYPDSDRGNQAQRDLWRNGFRRSAVVRAAPSGAIAIIGRSFMVRLGAALTLALLLGVSGSLEGRGLTGYTSPSDSLVFFVFFAALGGVLGWTVGRWLGVGVDDETIDYYRRWIVPGETMVIVHTQLAKVDSALQVLRRSLENQPAAFVLREPRSIDGKFASLPRERFTQERLRLHAAYLAGRHRIGKDAPRNYQLRSRLVRATRSIEEVTADLARVADLEQSVSPAAEWLLDNAYVIQRHSGDVRRNLSKRFYDVLPRLTSAESAGEPRVFDLAAELVARSEAEIHPIEVVDFVRAYQEVTPLTIGELWGLPLMLRFCLVEELSQLALIVERRQIEHEYADFWANRLLTAARTAPDSLLLMVAELTRVQPKPSGYVVDRLVSQLQGEATALDPIRAWLERKLGASIAEVIQAEQQRHAEDQMMIASAIGSLRELAQLDWREVFEQISVVEDTLAEDPAAIYARMDFGTRDDYRAAVEQVARRTAVAEVTVARLAVELAGTRDPNQHDGHVGYYLVDGGRSELESRLGYQPNVAFRVSRWSLGHPTVFYLGSIGVVTLALAGAAGWASLTAGAGASSVVPILVTLLLLFPASELAIQLVNSATTLVIPPRSLPKLSFAHGIPDEWRTLVVVPTLLMSPDSAREDVENLEIRYLANQDPNLRFALLADYTDASERVMSDDANLLELTVQGIEALNRNHGGNQFSLFYRDRIWSDSERVWMGWERKRGKLEEMNQWLLERRGIAVEKGRALTLHHAGSEESLSDIRFVITLDADTQLPHGTAHRLAGALAHPLNRPVLAANGNLVRSGYGIIQPRVSTSLPSANATRFARLIAGPAGTDPYTQAISDVYQDLFGEGIYHGKAIYDVEAFARVLGGRFADASLLSHDLLEGAHVRTGLASDVELFEQFPRTYQSFNARAHRWIRGDWQITAWCTPWVPRADGGSEANPLTAINRWKIFDNLRRSLTAPALVALLCIGWIGLPVHAVVWSVLVGLALLCAPLLQIVRWLASPGDAGRTTWRGWALQGTSWIAGLFSIVVLPQQAYTALDATVRVWYRRLISHRKLLEWQTFQMVHQNRHQARRGFLGQMVVVSLGAVALFAIVFNGAPRIVPEALTFLIPWLLAPVVVVWIDSDRRRSTASGISASDQQQLRRYARQTWRYFDDVVGPRTNWLPADNYQVALRVEVAARTSPTNVGLWLLSTLAAHDFGYATVDQVVERGAATFDTLRHLERYEGHLLNWYNVETLQPLPPRYVSTVDSGNLLASLWALAQGYRELESTPLIGPSVLEGLVDTLDLVRESVEAGRSEQVADLAKVDGAVARLATLIDAPRGSWEEIVTRLRSALGPARELVQILEARPPNAKTWSGASRLGDVAHDSRQETSDLSYWAAQIERQIDAWLAVVDRYCPWLAECDQSDVGFDAPTLATLASGEYFDCRRDRQKPDAPTGDNASAAHPPEWAPGVAASIREASEAVARIDALVERVDALADEMRLRFLYDPERRLFSIGYNVELRRLDRSYYDLLASESRLASLVAVARDDVPIDHWFTLGRPFGVADGKPVLLSWTGTMFEYLMPLLLTRRYENSLLDAACQTAVQRQIAYARRRNVPWGISEAAFSAVDANQIYQYQAFGVPDLGLKRDLGADLVVAPYATALALLVDAPAAVRNLRRLGRVGARGSYGFYDSIDYTPERRPEGKPGIVVATYMAHHQGMTLLAIDDVLHAGILQRRFHADQRIRAVEPLLFERMPVAPPVIDNIARGYVPTRPSPSGGPDTSAHLNTPDTTTPRVHLLANGSYALMITAAGGGYSRWRDVDVSRWRADATLDPWGSFIYIRDVERGVTWSTTHQPVHRKSSDYSVTFAVDRAAFARRDAGIATHTEIIVSTEADAEIRRVSLVNYSGRTRILDLTSYVELAMAPHNADRSHPAFSKLFVQTESVPERNALLAWRKLRSPHDAPIWATHVLVLPPDQQATVTYETDRAEFIGRGRGLENPVALERELSSRTGSVLDPIFSMRCRIAIEPGQQVQLAFVTGAGDSREAVLAIADRYQDTRSVERAFELAAFQAQLELRHLRVTAEDIQRFQQMASYMLFPSPRLRAAEPQLRQNRLGQSRLWAYGISGDLPIMVVTVGDRRDADAVSEALMAHTFWRQRGFWCDLVILNEEAGAYQQPLQDYLKVLVQNHARYTGLDQPGGIFLRPIEHIPSEDLTLLLSVARVVLVAARGQFLQQLSQLGELDVPPPLVTSPRASEEPSAALPFLELPYFNGLGGFTADGREYAIYLGPNTVTPAPWVNVMANPSFGALVSESGSGFAWYGNSQGNRLLPWSNDPVIDPPGDAIYIRDDESGVFWTPTPLPIREADAYRARHGQGYTTFEHNSHAIEQELVTFVPLDDAGGVPVRLQRLRLRNRSSRRRRLTITFYGEWVLGGTPEETQMHVVSTWDGESQSLLARNVYHIDYASRVAFASASLAVSSYTADRTEFLGRNGSRARPAALSRQSLSGRVGAGVDPCAALQVTVTIESGREAEVTFLLGQASDAAQARMLSRRFRDPGQVERALRTTIGWWDRYLGAIQVETPDLSVNFLLNRWLPYQTLSCRVWARSAFYQSGGAFGFRDQLQDVMSLVYAAPDLARRHILTAASRQFVEGDVQHWWHPQSGGGVRTRISDDMLWLPYAVCHYVRVTGDKAILDETVPFLEGHVLDPQEHEQYSVPSTALEAGTLLEHCRRAIERGMTEGPHGLPLIGTGDWNDGLNEVGVGHKGESVWLAWFLIDVLRQFAELLEQVDQPELVVEYRTRSAELAATVEVRAWDGGWYRRAYFDDGTPLGSHLNEEARIDSLPQTWGVISNGAIPSRAEQAMRAVEEYLIRDAEKLVLLFTPPFEKSEPNPGYVRGYPPGVRENGGQYTHGAIWVALAFARAGDGDRAVRVLRILNPVEHARNLDEAKRYKVEPYVVAADVYALEGNVGRGGWTWYTGSSGWMYRVWIEDVLGLKRRADQLCIEPVLPPDWPEVKVRYRYRGTTYALTIENPDRYQRGVAWIEVDGLRQVGATIQLQDDGQEHRVVVRLGGSTPA